MAKSATSLGFNHAPLITHAAQIQAAAQKAAFEVEEVERLRTQIKKLFGDIRRLGFDDAMEVTEEILPNHRPSTTPELRTSEASGKSSGSHLRRFFGGNQ